MSIQHIYFLDIETVPQLDIWRCDAYDEGTGKIAELYSKRFTKQLKEINSLPEIQKKNELQAIANEGVYDVGFSEHYESNAALYAEFGRILCISIGKLHVDGKFYIRSISGRDEATLLKTFVEKIADAKFVCGHNAKEFDVPFLVRRLIVHGLPIPEVLNTIDKKPWDVNILDTMVMWGSTQWNYKCGLELLCNILGIPSPKANFNGANVSELWFSDPKEGELPFDRDDRVLRTIGDYCNGDVLAAARLFCRIKGLSFVDDNKIVYL